MKQFDMVSTAGDTCSLFYGPRTSGAPRFLRRASPSPSPPPSEDCSLVPPYSGERAVLVRHTGGRMQIRDKSRNRGKG